MRALVRSFERVRERVIARYLRTNEARFSSIPIAALIDALRIVMKNNFTETYEFLVSVIGNAPYGIIAIDLDGIITMCNQLAIEHCMVQGLPYPFDQVCGW